MSTQEADTDTEADEASADTPGQFSGVIAQAPAEVLFKAVGAAQEEARFDFADDGLRAHNVDPANVVMSMADVPAGAWESYESTGLSLGFRLSRLSDLATTGGTADLEWLTDAHRLAVTSGPIDAELSAIDPDSVRTQQVTEQVWDGMTAEWTMPIDDLKTAVRSADKLHGDVVELLVEGERAWVRKIGDTDRIEVDFDHAEMVDAPDDQVRSLMNTHYLQELYTSMPPASADVTLTCYAATDWPFAMQYEHEGVEVTHCQAPRLESQ